MPTTRQSASRSPERPARHPRDPGPHPAGGPAPRPLDGPTRQELVHRERIDWHHHAVDQLVHPSSGVLRVSTPLGAWVVPPYRAVWIPAGVPHAHEAHGRTDMRTLSFPPGNGPFGDDRPTVVAVPPLLRELVVALTDAPDAAHPPYTAAQRADLERVALVQLRRVEALPLYLPASDDDRLRAVAALLRADPADDRTLAELGAAVGAGERTLSRLFRAELGMTFPQWRTQLRLHHSLTLLAAGHSVTSVATACGYANASAFIEAFRLAFGVTPGKGRTRPPGLPGPPR
ncbi:putative transcriptional regulator [Actinacidiphila reveromycinica]|uniref:HTH-type transcriptional regulator RipA n=1 Tax=Actinacidiphila reveromycinica TaxID=659352 RepID=A0A7U3USL1_9ACTN|nr:helix-turn-helix transcriptional regulator [Streptomyces sp. SN-593]BBA97976.1 putative transcriptional regulator [Streptomyces sp. SN-593]